MSELIEFLRARLDEDEQIARSTLSHELADERVEVWPAEWRVDGDWLTGVYISLGHTQAPEYINPEQGHHIARHDPARVLREVAAKRAIMDIHRRYGDVYRNVSQVEACHGCGFGGFCDDPNVDHVDDCPELRALAAIYSDHPDYREDWKP